MEHTTNVILEITWNDQETEHPSRWDWPTLLDHPVEDVFLIDSEEVDTPPL
jgi:hypothetical protein